MHSQFLLFIQLALVGFVAAQTGGNFIISNSDTSSYIFGTNQVPGDAVLADTGVSPLALAIDPAPGSANATVSTIYDPVSRLYVGINNATAGVEVIWVSDVFQWGIGVTPSGYILYPVDPDLFWIQNSTVLPFIDLIGGPDIHGSEAYWNITEAPSFS
ncbi:hypothetical protein AX15_006723 [Amanita polypyramis BW_CC]|nr:hypothetical protein AX15_006723 [Amanita polypyramis BW_CC]